jgi:hypothetical protein
VRFVWGAGRIACFNPVLRQEAMSASAMHFVSASGARDRGADQNANCNAHRKPCSATSHDHGDSRSNPGSQSDSEANLQ